MRVVVTGAGLAGLTAAVAVSRAGHDVLVCERDGHSPPPAARAFEEWDRSGVGHFRQPHNFLALARKTLYEEAPDLLERLAAVGAGEIDQTLLLPVDAREPEDAELATIACRRPVFEAVLREMAASAPNVEVRSGVVVDGLVVDRPNGDVVVRGVRSQGATIEADLVVDAAGRTSRVRSWLEAAGGKLPERREQDCGIVYFSRHFRFRDGVLPPGGPYILGGPRGDLGYLAYAVFVGDDHTFCVVLMTAPGDGDFKALRSAEGHQAVVSRIPGLCEWVHDDVAEAVTSCLFMGLLTNTVQLLHGDTRAVRGIRPVGDALSHTNPTFAFGASMALRQGFSLGTLLGEYPDPLEASEAFEALHGPDLVARFEAVSAEDVDRQRWWSGELSDPTDPSQSMALALRFAVYPAAGRDPEIFPAVARRIGALDPVGALVARSDLINRAMTIRRRAAEGAPAAALPSRDELVAVLR
jgi:2-polyprenyl-6-methoxyphenol hydroxylase-like FAD-dependent oxidoreductase